MSARKTGFSINLGSLCIWQLSTEVSTLGVSQVWYQGGVKSTVSEVFEDLKFKLSEGYDQNLCFPDSVQLAVSAKLRQLIGQTQEITNFGPSLLKF